MENTNRYIKFLKAGNIYFTVHRSGLNIRCNLHYVWRESLSTRWKNNIRNWYDLPMRGRAGNQPSVRIIVTGYITSGLRCACNVTSARSTKSRSQIRYDARIVSWLSTITYSDGIRVRKYYRILNNYCYLNQAVFTASNNVSGFLSQKIWPLFFPWPVASLR